MAKAQVVGRVEAVDAKTAKAWLDEGKARLVDVRDPHEYAAEHIVGAELMPLSQLDPAAFDGDERAIVVHCQSGMRAREGATRLAQHRGEVVYCVGGIADWKAAGLPIEKHGKAPLPIVRQVMIGAGAMIVVGTVLAALVSPWWLVLPGFVGFGLLNAGVTGFCPMATALGYAPWNRVPGVESCPVSR